MGTSTIIYTWSTFTPLTTTVPLAPWPSYHEMTATVRAAKIPVPAAASSWGRIKRHYH